MKIRQMVKCIEGYCGVCSLVLIFITFGSAYADALIPPNDPKINYYGRFDGTDPAKPKCNWSGAVIEASFPGPTIGMQMEYANAFYDVEIDGVRDTIIPTGSAKNFIFRNDLSPQNHTVRIVLRSENHYSAGTFLGLYLADGKALSDPPAKPSRKIEFIGDSYTAGYGIESASRSCSSDQLNKFTNANRAFAAQVTRAFHAQSTILGWSGAGMVRNYGEGGKRSEKPFPFYYDSTLGATWGGGKWDFSTWKPELVVICLGTNDYSTAPHPDDSMYVGDYHKFIARILGNYPDASILCVSTGDTTFEKNLRRVVTEETTTLNHPKVYFAAYPASLEASGCDWHPSINDNIKIAAILTDTIMKKLGWDTAASVVTYDEPAAKSTRRSPGGLSGRMINGRFEVAFEGKTAAVPIVLVTINGELIERKIADAGKPVSFSMNRHCPGVYLAGNAGVGWARAVVRR